MDTSKLNENYTNITNLGFNQVWSGAAYATSRESLNDMMGKLNKCLSDISEFDAILVLKEQYIAICDKISEYYGYISACSSTHGEEEKENGCGTCSYYSGEITKLETQRKDLRTEIIGKLGKFSGVEAEIAPPIDFSATVSETPANDIVLNEVPRYAQQGYGETKYGNYLLRTHGCGITCLAMVASYMNDDPTLTPDVLAERYGGVYSYSGGTDGRIFPNTAEELGLGTVRTVWDWNSGGVEQALREGSLVVAVQQGGPFTTGGHYILLTGISEDAEGNTKIHVNDPNMYNWEKLADGFENGFDPSAIKNHNNGLGYYIYEPKKTREDDEE